MERVSFLLGRSEQRVSAFKTAGEKPITSFFEIDTNRAVVFVQFAPLEQVNAQLRTFSALFGACSTLGSML